VAWVVWLHPDPTDGRFDDTAWYRLSAHYIAIGAGYVNPYSGTPTASWPPAYPYFLGGVFKLFGEGLPQTYGANIALSLAAIVFVYCIGVELFDRRTAFIGCLALAVWPGQVYFASLTLSEALFTALFTLALLAALRIPQTRAWRGPLVLLFGLAAGVAVLTRAQALLLLPLAMAAWALAGMRWRETLAWGALGALVVGLVLAPWAVRNERELGSPVLIASNLGTNLLLGHYPGSTGRSGVRDALPLVERGDLSLPEYEVKASNEAQKDAIEFAFTNPRDEVRLSGAKIRALYESDTTAIDWIWGFHPRDRSGARESFLRDLANAFWFTGLVFAGVGLAVSRAQLRGPAAVLPLTVALWTFGHLVFFGDPRYHYPIVFVFALLGARGVVVLYEAARRPEPRLGGRYATA